MLLKNKNVNMKLKIKWTTLKYVQAFQTNTANQNDQLKVIVHSNYY